ncbi:SDR family oxidoreductase [Halomonas sp. PR-M31]|uniref:SDR family oxidoreductase n=1 Tax=Halomonas sp. PR-M31 TaxID=1471202 RepID=UPI000ABA60FC|nr:SDR family oxidoreductase [Halomonas sp. PR-M31]
MKTLEGKVAIVTGAMGSVAELSEQNWHDTLDTNLTSAFLGAKCHVPAMIERGAGSLIFTSSFVGHTVGFPDMVAYAASKGGMIGMVQVLASEFGANDIRANAVLPGGTDTPTNIANLPGAESGTRDFIEGLHALKRLAKPEEIARTVLHLASDASSFITGAAILVDGGVSITRT